MKLRRAKNNDGHTTKKVYLPMRTRTIVTLSLALSLLACGKDSSAPAATSSHTATTTPAAATTPAASATATATPTPTPKAEASAMQLSATLDGKAWKAGVVAQGALFYEKGAKMWDPSGKPFLQLSFQAAAPDTRNLTMQLTDFATTTGKIDSSKQEVLFTGSETGDPNKALMAGFKLPALKTDFTLELTKWERPSPDKAIASFSVTGTLKGTMGSPSVVFENGVIENLEIRVYTEAY